MTYTQKHMKKLLYLLFFEKRAVYKLHGKTGSSHYGIETITFEKLAHLEIEHYEINS